MTNREAIDVLKNDHDVYSFGCPVEIRKKFFEAKNIAINALEEQDKHRWIPVSKRLPEDRKEKLVWLSSGRMTIAMYNEHILPSHGKPIGWGYNVNHPFDFTKEKVIAWQPLTEPYKGENK